jgi:hypothetical protein
MQSSTINCPCSAGWMYAQQQHLQYYRYCYQSHYCYYPMYLLSPFSYPHPSSTPTLSYPHPSSTRTLLLRLSPTHTLHLLPPSPISCPRPSAPPTHTPATATAATLQFMWEAVHHQGTAGLLLNNSPFVCKPVLQRSTCEVASTALKYWFAVLQCSVCEVAWCEAST